MRDTAQQAADLFKMQRYDEAAAKYQEIIEKYPESLYAWSNLGVVRFQQGKLHEALKALQQAVKLSPTDAFSYSNLGIVYYQMNQYEHAIDALERPWRSIPTTPRATIISAAPARKKAGRKWPRRNSARRSNRRYFRRRPLQSRPGLRHRKAAVAGAGPPPLQTRARTRHQPDPRLEKLLQMDGVAQNPTASDQK